MQFYGSMGFDHTNSKATFALKQSFVVCKVMFCQREVMLINLMKQKYY